MTQVASVENETNVNMDLRMTNLELRAFRYSSTCQVRCCGDLSVCVCVCASVCNQLIAFSHLLFHFFYFFFAGQQADKAWSCKQVWTFRGQSGHRFWWGLNTTWWVLSSCSSSPTHCLGNCSSVFRIAWKVLELKPFPHGLDFILQTDPWPWEVWRNQWCFWVANVWAEYLTLP